MASLDKIAKTKPATLKKMDKEELDSLMTGSMKDIATALKKLEMLDGMSDGINATNSKLGVLEERIVSAENDITTVKQDAADMRTEINELKARIDNEEGARSHVTDIEARLDRMQEEMNNQMEYLTQTAVYHQGMLESVDARFRGTHVIISGVKENDTTLGATDKEKVLNIIQKTGCLTQANIGDYSVKRLGEIKDGHTWPRALHVTLDSHDKQRKILEHASKLKGVSNCERIYIRKDTHPTVRFEQNRLRKKVKEEKENPQNHGLDINYDHKKRVLLKEGRIIDRFCPSFR